MTLHWPEEKEDLLASINTTPLVDVMLVLLIIFLITVPVVIHSVPVRLPKESSRPTQTAPQNITISVDRDGRVFWNAGAISDRAELVSRLEGAAAMDPQPEIHLRGDREGRYGPVGEVVAACRRAGISRIGFITEPTPAGQ